MSLTGPQAAALVSGYDRVFLELNTGTPESALADIRDDPDALRQWKLLLKHSCPAFAVGTSRDYLALVCLLQVRDLVAHRHARTLALGSFPTSLSDCVRQRIVPVHRAAGADRTSVLFVVEVAEWAAATAKAWLAVADAQLPLPS